MYRELRRGYKGPALALHVRKMDHYLGDYPWMGVLIYPLPSSGEIGKGQLLHSIMKAM